MTSLKNILSCQKLTARTSQARSDSHHEQDVLFMLTWPYTLSSQRPTFGSGTSNQNCSVLTRPRFVQRQHNTSSRMTQYLINISKGLMMVCCHLVLRSYAWQLIAYFRRAGAETAERRGCGDVHRLGGNERGSRRSTSSRLLPEPNLLIFGDGQAWSEKDVTMQAGKQRGALPLIRKFNEHSERLLKASGYVLLASHHTQAQPSILVGFPDPKDLRPNGDE